MEMKLILALLLLASVSFAWSSGYSPPSCISQYSVLGYNFSITQSGVPQTCTVSIGAMSLQPFYNKTEISSGGGGGTSLTAQSNTPIFSVTTTPVQTTDPYGEKTTQWFIDIGSYIGNLTGNFLGASTLTVGGGTPSSTGTHQLTISNGTSNITLSYVNSTAFGSGYNYSFPLIVSSGSISNGTHQITTSGTIINATLKAIFSAGCAQCYGYATTSIIPAQTLNYPTFTEINSRTANDENFTARNYFGFYNGYALRSDITTGSYSNGNSSNNCKSLLYYGTTLIIPKITYIPTTDAFASFYNISSTVAFVPNNTVTYIMDTNNVWYVLPAFTCSNYNLIYTNSVYVYPYSASSAVLSLPKLYPIQNCYSFLGTFYWDIKGTSSQTYYYAKQYTNGSVDTTTFTGLQYTGNTNVSNTLNVTITDGTNVVCAWGNGTSLLFAAPAFLQENVTSLMGKMSLLALTGVSTVTPFAVFGMILVNDTFSILPQEQIFAFCLIAVIFSAFINGYMSKSLKNFGWYLGAFLAVFAFYSVQIPNGTGTTVAGLDAVKTQLSGLSTDTVTLYLALTSSNSNLLAIFTGGLSLIYSLLTTLVLLPIYLSQAILSPLAAINPTLANIASLIMGMTLTLGIAVYLSFKVFEMGTKQYLPS